jgi:hypothetical protein
VQDVDGAVVLRVDADLVGEEAEAEVVVVFGGEGGELGEVGGFEDVDAGLGVGIRGTSGEGIPQGLKPRFSLDYETRG